MKLLIAAGLAGAAIATSCKGKFCSCGGDSSCYNCVCTYSG